MLLAIVITVLCFVMLIILHELGHFLLAKLFGMRVDEFAVGFPPRLWARKIGKTLYSFNALLLGGFVKIHGEDILEQNTDQDSFSNKPLWQRVLVVLGGVLAFWVVAWVLLSFLAGSQGLPAMVGDQEPGVKNPIVQITQVIADSGAAAAGVAALDQIQSIATTDQKIDPLTIAQVQQFIHEHANQELALTVTRQNQPLILKVKVNEQGLIGIGLARIAWISSPWYAAPAQGLEATYKITGRILGALGDLLSRLVSGQRVENADVRGPIGIGELFVQAFNNSIGYFVYFLAIISIYLAIFNLLPIPAVDGGRLLFLLLEGLRGKPIAPRLEARVHNIFFLFLLTLLVLVSVFDVLRLF